jgi:hypothetical protein
MRVIKQILTKSETENTEKIINGLRSAMQEVALAGLARAGFFDRAAFCGANCLRIFNGLPRFSEGLHFCLLEPDANFPLESYFDVLWHEFASLGMDVQISQKKKPGRIYLESAFLTNDSFYIDLSVLGEKTLTITFELYTQPPRRFSIDEKILQESLPFSVRCLSLSDLFVEKMHLLLFMDPTTRVNGREWFDFAWFVTNGVQLHLAHLIDRSHQSGHLRANEFSEQYLHHRLKQRISSIDISHVRKEVYPFIEEQGALNNWSKEYFHKLAYKLIIIR